MWDYDGYDGTIAGKDIMQTYNRSICSFWFHYRLSPLFPPWFPQSRRTITMLILELNIR